MQRTSIAAGALAIAGVLATGLVLPASWRESVRDNAFDLVLAADYWLRPMRDPGAQVSVQGSAQGGHRVVVVDIDRRSLEAVGSWPWPRATTAALIEVVAAAKPAAMAVDILFAERDSRCPAALAAACEWAAPAGRASGGDELLARAASQAPLVIGFVLDPAGQGTLPRLPFATRGAPSLDEIWRADGAVVPPATLIESAHGIGALSLSAARDGVVRNVPLLVGVGDRVLPGLALDTMRVAHGAPVYLLEAAPPLLATGDFRIPFTPDGFLRLAPVAPERRAARTISAIDVIERKVDPATLAGAILLIGGSAPELGGLRETKADSPTPSVQIQADAVEQIAAGRFPRPIGGGGWTQPLLGFGLVLGLGLLALGIAITLPPILAALALIAIVASTWATAITGSLLTDRLMEPLTPSFAAVVVFVVVSVVSFATTRRREAFVRRRFEQHLAPAVVQRIIEQRSPGKLAAESREVTALFTDVEGFTAMTHRAGPEELVAMLDQYFEGVAAIVVAHGGMIDKIVGDAVHALFNAPLDLDDHPRRAVECALAIRAWTEHYREQPLPVACGFGRTRIGIETGRAVVGDVGLGAKLDYTAHGDAVNAAARLEAANKELGSTICVGPAAAIHCDADLLRPLGTISLRGRDEPMAVFEPWPADAPVAWRARYLEAFALIDHDLVQAAAQFAALALERPGDLVVREMAKRLRTGAVRACA